MLVRPKWREVCLKISIKILVFVVLYVEDGTLQKIEKILKVTRFLRHASLDKNVFYKYAKSGVYTSYIKREIDVKK